MTTVEDCARAKVNLTLHVTGQRADGYHLLDSLVVFADVGDVVSVSAAEDFSLVVDGPEAAGVPVDDSNLVLRAARLFAPDRPVAIRLTKNLPTAAGIGGGSADAAATVRALARLWSLPLPEAGTLAPLGADVPVCLASAPARMGGIGDVLSPVPALPAHRLVLVNPRVPVETPPIFKALRKKDNPAMGVLPDWGSAVALAEWLAQQRNDLFAPALEQQPAIAEVIDALRAEGALFAGMSGSGATCLGVFAVDAGDIRSRIAAAHPEWWV